MEDEYIDAIENIADSAYVLARALEEAGVEISICNVLYDFALECDAILEDT